MARRKPAQDNVKDVHATELQEDLLLTRAGVLVVGAGPTARLCVQELSPIAGRVVLAKSGPEALSLLRREACEVMVICDEGSGGLMTVAAEARRMGLAVAGVAYEARPTVESAVEAMRLGLLDMIGAPAGGEELARRLEAALVRVLRERGRELELERRVQRFKLRCRELKDAKEELLRQVNVMCGDMAAAYRDVSSRIEHVAMASELNAILRQELDLDGLLRTVLEFVLKRTGPTNAAVFLPSSSGDWSLGAYANYDKPRDTVETMLDSLCDGLAPVFAEQEGVAIVKGRQELEAALGERAHWLGNSTLAAFPCVHEGETLAVVALFRDKQEAFAEGTAATLRIVADLFGAQLGRVVRTHHRHLPKHKWGSPGDPPGGDDIDLAA